LPKVTAALDAVRGIFDALSKQDWGALQTNLAKLLPTDWAHSITRMVIDISDAIKTGDWAKVRTEIWNAIKSAVEFAATKISEAAGKLLDAFTKWSSAADTQKMLFDLGYNLPRALVDGIKELFNAKETSTGIGQSVIVSLKKAFDALSKDLAQIGAGAALSVIDGFTNQFADAKLRDRFIKIFTAIMTGNYSGILDSSGSLPGFAAGGIVPGAIGQPHLAVVHGGEEVLTPRQRGGRSGDTYVYAPMFAFGTRAEAENAFQEFHNKATLRARSRQIGATK
jgi:hypothetical protein